MHVMGFNTSDQLNGSDLTPALATCLGAYQNVNYCGNKACKHSWFSTKLLSAVSYSTSQDATNHVTTKTEIM